MSNFKEIHSLISGSSMREFPNRFLTVHPVKLKVSYTYLLHFFQIQIEYKHFIFWYVTPSSLTSCNLCFPANYMVLHHKRHHDYHGFDNVKCILILTRPPLWALIVLVSQPQN